MKKKLYDYKMCAKIETILGSRVKRRHIFSHPNTNINLLLYAKRRTLECG